LVSDTCLVRSWILNEPRFWAIGHMLFSLDGIVSETQAWAKGCPCHDHLTAATTSSYLRRAAYNRELGQKFPSKAGSACPCQGCRAPELAAGKFQESMPNIGVMFVVVVVVVVVVIVVVVVAVVVVVVVLLLFVVVVVVAVCVVVCLCVQSGGDEVAC
jgi:hypothetical protein